MAGVRNGPLVQVVTTAAGNTQLAAVPPGFTWLIKTAHFHNASAAPAVCALALSDAVGSVLVGLPAVTVEPGTSGTWEGWTALGPGDRLLIGADQFPIHVWVAGAELPGALPEGSTSRT